METIHAVADNLDTIQPTHSNSTPAADTTLPDTGSLWRRICQALQARMGRENFERWFSGVTAETTDDGKVILTLPNPIHHLWIETNYAGQLSEVITEVAGGPRHIEFRVSEAQSQPSQAPLTVPLVGASFRGGRQLARSTEAAASSVSAPDDEVRIPRTFAEAGLNPKHSFDNFVVGPNSHYSVAVARAVAEKPGRIYNPLFFYGGAGLGKTHLTQAIGREILLGKKKAIVRYVTSEQFTNDFVEAIKNQTLPQFRRKYRNVDVLLIDDVHFFIRKDSTQEEFFHTFNELFNNSKQIVLASDRAPAELKDLEERLVSRFEWGLTTQIQTPDFETRTAILRKKLADLEDAPEAEPWVLEFIAQRIRTNVRKLEGALARLAAHVSLEGRAPASEPALEALLHDVLDQEPARTVSVDLIQRTVATRYDLRVSDLTGPRRPSNIAEARQVAMYLTRHITKLPLTQIGEEFGNRDHGTVIHACKVVSARMGGSDEFRRLVEALIAKVVEG